MRMGLREANQNFSKAIKAVRSGKQVVLTERGIPIAVIQPLQLPSSEVAVLQRLRDTGVLRATGKGGILSPWKPVRLKGVPITETLHKERDER